MEKIEKDIRVLRDHYGTFAKVAQVIGISYRHLANIRRYKRASKQTLNIIEMLIDRIDKQEPS